MDDGQLRNVWQNHQRRESIMPLSVPMSRMTQQLAKHVRQMGRLSMVWDECVPEEILRHAALVSYNRGVVTAAVDSAPHRYKLQMLLSNGLIAAIRERFSGPINRIRLVPGPFDALNLDSAEA
jgi:hypothetical protein